jgi:hypothetical protein
MRVVDDVIDHSDKVPGDPDDQLAARKMVGT